MLIALEAGLQKLREYYAKTDQPKAGNVYAHSTILAPKSKLQYFRRKEWSGGPGDSQDQTWAEYYHDTLQDRIKSYQLEYDPTFTSIASRPQGSELDRMLDDEGEADLDQDELARYLQAGKPLLLSLLTLFLIFISLGIIRTTPQAFWKANQAEYPTLVRVARDIFSIPATGAGVERLFNLARDICHYRRGRLNASTIQDLMMFSCLTQFEIEDHQLELARALEVPEEGENDQISASIEGIDPISDTEEGDEEVRLSVRVGKRRQSVLSDHEGEESDNDCGLPFMSQIRQSGRVRKAPKT